jgi:hypothetical protein
MSPQGRPFFLLYTNEMFWGFYPTPGHTDEKSLTGIRCGQNQIEWARDGLIVSRSLLTQFTINLYRDVNYNKLWLRMLHNFTLTHTQFDDVQQPRYDSAPDVTFGRFSAVNLSQSQNPFICYLIYFTRASIKT